MSEEFVVLERISENLLITSCDPRRQLVSDNCTDDVPKPRSYPLRFDGLTFVTQPFYHKLSSFRDLSSSSMTTFPFQVTRTSSTRWLWFWNDFCLLGMNVRCSTTSSRGSVIVLHIKHYLNYIFISKTNINLSECACRHHYRLVRNQHHRLRDAYEVVVRLVRTQRGFHSLQLYHYHWIPPNWIIHC
jgi:hypothetical protein